MDQASGAGTGGGVPGVPALTAADFFTRPARTWDEAIATTDGDFLAIDEWIHRCAAPTATTTPCPTTDGEPEHETAMTAITASASASSSDPVLLRRVLLLTLIYHSSPYSVLRRVLDELTTPPPASAAAPITCDPTVFTQQAEEDDCSSSSSSVSPPSGGLAAYRTRRSADVRIAQPHHSSTNHSHNKRTEWRPASFDPLQSTLSTSASSSSRDGTPLSGTSATTSFERPSPSVLASSGAASTGISLPPSSVESIASSNGIAPQTSSTIAIPSRSGSSAHRRPPPPPPPPPRSSVHALWFARKVQLMTLLHEWLRDFPQDFCCEPHVSTGAGAEAQLSATSSPQKHLLEDLLYSALAPPCFPPPAWHEMASRNAASFHLDEGGGGGRSLSDRSHPPPPPPRRRPPPHPHRLSEDDLDTFRDLSSALLRDYEASRAKYLGGDRVEGPLWKQLDMTMPAANTTVATTTTPTTATPTTVVVLSPSLKGHLSSASPRFGPLSPSSLGGLRASTVGGAAGSSTGGSGGVSPWNRSLGARTIERNMENEKVRRMMDMSPPEANKIASPTAAAARSPTAGAFSSPSFSLQLPSTTLKFVGEFLGTPAKDHVAALTWLAIQRMEEIAECHMETDTSGSSAGSGGATTVGTGACAVSVKSTISYHQPACLPSVAFLRLFLGMPRALARRQMKLSNTMSCFVATTILNTPSVAARKKVIHHWLEIAEGCLGLTIGPNGKIQQPQPPSSSSVAMRHANFMHCFEIIYGINHQSVYRLPAVQTTRAPDGKDTVLSKTILPLLHKRNFASAHAYDIYTELTRLTSPNGNYREYRRTLAEAQQQQQQQVAAGSRASSIVIVPYIGILMKDLVSLEEAGKPLAGVRTESAPPSSTAAEEEEEAGSNFPSPSSSAGALRRVPRAHTDTVVMKDDFSPQDDDGSSSSPSSSSSSSVGGSPPPPTGSLPWDDSFLVRPRRNATLLRSVSDEEDLPHSGGLPSAHGSKLAAAGLDDEEDIFVSPQSPPTPSPHLPPPLPPPPSASVEDAHRRETLLQMLTSESSSSSSSVGVPTASKPSAISLLTAALPNHRTGASGSSGGGELSSTRQSNGDRANSTASASSTADGLGGSGGAGGGAPSSSSSSSSSFLLNFTKLSKIYAVVDTALRCRLQYPQVPLSEETPADADSAAAVAAAAAGVAPAPRDRSMTLAAHRYTVSSAGGGGASDSSSPGGGVVDLSFFLSAARVATAARATPAVRRDCADPPSVHRGNVADGSDGGVVSPSPPVGGVPPAGRVDLRLAFSSSLQQWLLASMLTMTLREEAQLMERSYAIYPRKRPQAK